MFSTQARSADALALSAIWETFHSGLAGLCAPGSALLGAVCPVLAAPGLPVNVSLSGRRWAAAAAAEEEEHWTVSATQRGRPPGAPTSAGRLPCRQYNLTPRRRRQTVTARSGRADGRPRFRRGAGPTQMVMVVPRWV